MLDDPESVHISVKLDQQCLLVRVVRTLWAVGVVKWMATCKGQEFTPLT